MTHNFKFNHTCESCKDRRNGVFVVVCVKTGIPIETYKQTIERIIANPTHFVYHHPGIDEH